MKIYHSDHFSIHLPAAHRFPIMKYALLRERIEAAGIARPGDLQVAPPASDVEILRVHTPAYWHSIKDGSIDPKAMRRIGFPWSPELVERARRSVGGTLAACRSVLGGAGPLAANLAGGTHHAYADHGEGYCILNDVAIAARAMQAEERARKILVIDCDVHQGNGTAAIFASDPDVYTFSIHAEKNYPFQKEISRLDIHLPDEAGDGEYLAALQSGLETAIEDSRAELAIYIAGADPFIGDKLGRLALSKPGLLARDRLVFNAYLGAGLPAAIVMGGGYGRLVEDTVEIQYHTIELGNSSRVLLQKVC